MASTVWKGQIAFGLVSIPVRIFRAARKERLTLHRLAPATAPPETDEAEDVAIEPEREPAISVSPVSRIAQSAVRRDDREPVAESEVLRGHEIAPGQYVTFHPQELRALRVETSSEMRILRAVRLDEIDPVYFETSYYVAPDRGGERAYALLFSALKSSGYVALATVAMHGREHVTAIRPGRKGLLAHTLFYREEVRAETEYDANVSNIPAKELQLAETFIAAIAGPFAPEEFRDTHREKLEAMIAARQARGEIAGAADTKKETAAAPVVDIMDALRRSIEARKGGTAPPRREPARAGELKRKQPKRGARG